MGFRKGHNIAEIAFSIAIVTAVSILSIDLYAENFTTLADNNKIVKADNSQLTMQTVSESEVFYFDPSIITEQTTANISEVFTTTAGQGTLREAVINAYRNQIENENKNNISEQTINPQDFDQDSSEAIKTGYFLFLYINSEDYYKNIAIAVPFKNDTYFIDFVGSIAIQYKIDNVSFEDIIYNDSAENQYWNENTMQIKYEFSKNQAYSYYEIDTENFIDNNIRKKEFMNFYEQYINAQFLIFKNKNNRTLSQSAEAKNNIEKIKDQKSNDTTFSGAESFDTGKEP